MLVENAGVSVAEDALSTYYSTGSHTDSTASVPSGSFATTTSASSTSSSSSVRDRRGEVEKLEKIDGEKDEDVEHEEVYWWDDNVDVAFPVKPYMKGTPHMKKVLAKLPPSIRKCVRFDLENTPEDRTARPFTPLFTSTPKPLDAPNDGSDEDDDLPPLRDIDSNTCVLPASAGHNNTSSILLSNVSVMESWNKSRQQTEDALRQTTQSTNYYKVCYDDTDEEEVVEDNQQHSEAPVECTPSRRTFVISSESESSSKTATLHEQSFEHDHEHNTSTDSSVVLELDRLEDYIRHLEDEIDSANRFSRKRDIIRGRGAVRRALVLQERIDQMKEEINEICGKFAHHDDPDDYAADGDREHMSAAFEDSGWSAQLNSDDGSFGANQL
ncbi:unnamed protein product [Caenorhabditis sp. 36 PRJEB53466]|nr:unnamed protein product [Caenorhabditis sp. 36 PRJEB53466]